jgi:hypothetical protein
MRGAIPQLPQYAFMAWCLVKHRDNFALYLYLYLFMLSHSSISYVQGNFQIKFIAINCYIEMPKDGRTGLFSLISHTHCQRC